MSHASIKCVIVDDEKLARTLLTRYIEQMPQLELVAACKGANEAKAVLDTTPVDLLFLDIQMPERTGIELLGKLERQPLVVFTTAYEQYALEGYQLDIVDYLLKPFRFERFVQAVNKAERRLQLPVGSTAPAEERPFLYIKADSATHKVLLDDIVYIKGMKEYVIFHLASDKRLVSLQALKNLELELPANQFIRIHKSYIVAIAKITAVDAGHVYLGKEQAPIGGNYKAEVQKLLF